MAITAEKGTALSRHVIKILQYIIAIGFANLSHTPLYRQSLFGHIRFPPFFKKTE